MNTKLSFWTCYKKRGSCSGSLSFWMAGPSRTFTDLTLAFISVATTQSRSVLLLKKCVHNFDFSFFFLKKSRAFISGFFRRFMRFKNSGISETVSLGVKFLGLGKKLKNIFIFIGNFGIFLEFWRKIPIFSEKAMCCENLMSLDCVRYHCELLSF